MEGFTESLSNTPSSSTDNIQSQRTKQRPLHWTHERIRLLWVYKSFPLGANVLRDICDYFFSPSELISLKHSQIRCFDVIQKKWKVMCNLSADLAEDYGFCYTLTMCDAGTFVICGGLRNRSSAHIIEDGKVSALPNLMHGRYSHGAVYIPLCFKVYLFGGAYTGAIRHCESLDLLSQTWQAIAPMHMRRADINPLLYGHLVFIVAGDRDCTIETYDWRRNCFAIYFSFEVPKTTHFLSVITGDLLLCISEHCNCRVNLQKGQVSDTYKHEAMEICSVVSMVKSDKVVVFTDGHKCTLYSLADGMHLATVLDY